MSVLSSKIYLYNSILKSYYGATGNPTDTELRKLVFNLYILKVINKIHI